MPDVVARSMRSWTHAEEEALRYLGPRLGGPECAKAFDRSLDSIYRKASRLGISFGRETCGRKVAGLSSEAVLRRIRELSDALLCPACGFRFAAVKTTGLCGLCHVRHLKIVHEEEIAKIEAQRDLWAVRSKLQRRRRSLSAEAAAS